MINYTKIYGLVDYFMKAHIIENKIKINIFILLICLTLVACQPLFVSNSPVNSNATITAAAIIKKNTNPTQQNLTTLTPTISTQLIKVDPIDLHGLNIEVWHSWSGEAGTVFEDLAATFNQNNLWGIFVTPEYKGNSDLLQSNLSAGIDKTGELPHIAVGYSYEIFRWINERQVFVNYDEYLNDTTWGMIGLKSPNPYSIFLASDQFLGKQWAIPAWRNAHLLFYNQSWAKQLGFNSPPVSLDDFYEQACSSSNANASDDDIENDGTGGWIIDLNYLSTISWIKSNGGEIIDPVEQIFQFQTDEVEETFQFLKKLYENKCSWIPESHLPVSEFATRKGLFIAGDLTDIPFIAREFEQANNQDGWSIIPFPAINDKPVISVYGQSFALLKTTEAEQLASWLFIKHVLAPENHARLTMVETKFPLTLEEANLLKTQSSNQYWLSSFSLIPYAITEPNLPSWTNIRWAISDATSQLYQWYFKPDQIPDLVKLLDQTAKNLNATTK